MKQKDNISVKPTIVLMFGCNYTAYMFKALFLFSFFALWYCGQTGSGSLLWFAGAALIGVVLFQAALMAIEFLVSCASVVILLAVVCGLASLIVG